MTRPTLLTDAVFPIILIIDDSCFSLQKKPPKSSIISFSQLFVLNV